MVSQANSISRRHGGARVGAGRPRLRQRVSETPSIGLAELEPGTASVAIVDGDKTLRARVVCTPCKFGGQRTWLCCPSCPGRVRRLFLGLHTLACQQCLRLQHDSQLEGVVARSQRRTRNLKEKLPLFNKPKWMRWPTYERLRRALINEHQLRTEILALVAGGEHELTAALQVQIALDARRATALTDNELCRALKRISRLRAQPSRSH